MQPQPRISAWNGRHDKTEEDENHTVSYHPDVSTQTNGQTESWEQGTSSEP